MINLSKPDPRPDRRALSDTRTETGQKEDRICQTMVTCCCKEDACRLYSSSNCPALPSLDLRCDSWRLQRQLRVLADALAPWCLCAVGRGYQRRQTCCDVMTRCSGHVRLRGQLSGAGNNYRDWWHHWNSSAPFVRVKLHVHVHVHVCTSALRFLASSHW